MLNEARRHLPWIAITLLAGLPASGPAAETSSQRAEPAACADAEWYAGAVFYGVVPPLFGAEPFDAVIARLDDLQALGVDAIWLSPIHPTDDPSAISYSVTDYLGVRPDFGDPEDLRRLVREAHARGMRVLMDFVPNHTSARHPFFLDAAAKGPASRFYNFYARDADGQPTHYFNWEWLKNLNYRNPEVRRLIIDAFSHWVREFDIDGFRVDAAWGIRERAPDFWPELDRALTRIKPGVFLLAEASARDPYYVSHGFDAAYDWTHELGKWAWESAFADLRRVGPGLERALAPGPTPMSRVARFLNNNDTGDRFVTRHGVEATRVAAVLLHALPGIPIVYTGDEVGAEFRPYDDPAPIKWNDVHELRPLYRTLARLREELPALRCGSFTSLRSRGSSATYAFVRDAGASDLALVVLNFGPATRLKLELPAGVRDRLAPRFEDVLTRRDVAGVFVGPNTLELAVPGSTAWVLVPGARRGAP